MTWAPGRGDYPAAVVDAPDQPQPQPAVGPQDGPAGPVEPPDDPFGPPSVQVEAVAPPVVVAMVAHDPGPWFEEALRSVATQTYRNTSLLVIDGHSAEDLAPRIAAIVPDAHVRRLEADVGFGPAANEVLEAVEGADFYLFCHDDVRLEPDAIQVMVEEAFRSNAGIVGAKLVDWDDPEQLLQVGMGADKTGAPAPYVDRGELDQEQHDAVRDVFYVPGAATLVRADLFSALGGFDPEIELLGEDLDLSWRAHVVGARVLVAPAARIAHLEALGHRRPVDDRRRLQMRHRLRTSRVCYTAPSRVRVLPQAAAIALVEFVYGVVTGRFRHAGDVLSAWTWNLRHRRSTRQLRRGLAEHRRVPDRDVRSLQVHGSARWSAFVRGQRGAGQNRLGTVTASGREMVTNLRSARARSSLIAWCAVLVVLLLGSRDLFTNGVPTIGQLAAFPSHPSQLVQQWVSGFRSTRSRVGHARPRPCSACSAGSGTSSSAPWGCCARSSSSARSRSARSGIWRLARPLGSRRARITALVVYVCLPLGINALARGRWDGLVLYGFMPWILNQLARASGRGPVRFLGRRRRTGRGRAARDPTHPDAGARDRAGRAGRTGRRRRDGGHRARPRDRRPARRRGPRCAAADGGGAGRRRRRGRAPAAVEPVGRVARVARRGRAVDDRVRAVVALGPAALRHRSVRVHPARLGVPAGRPPGAAHRQELAAPVGGAVRGWSSSDRWRPPSWPKGWRPDGSPRQRCCSHRPQSRSRSALALGMVAFEVDLPDYHFGLRQIASLVAGVALVLGIFPALGAAFSGDWGLPASDFSSTFSNLGAKDAQRGPYRLLWLGEAEVVPGAPWQLVAPTIGQLGRAGALAYTHRRRRHR